MSCSCLRGRIIYLVSGLQHIFFVGGIISVCCCDLLLHKVRDAWQASAGRRLVRGTADFPAPLAGIRRSVFAIHLTRTHCPSFGGVWGSPGDMSFDSRSYMNKLTDIFWQGCYFGFYWIGAPEQNVCFATIIVGHRSTTVSRPTLWTLSLWEDGIPLPGACCPA